MKRRLVFLAFGVILTFAICCRWSASAGSVTGGKQGTITLRNAGSFDNTYELFDNVCNQALPDRVIQAHKTSALSLCTSPQGYGSFKSRIKGNTTWNNHDLLSEGQVIDP